MSTVASDASSAAASATPSPLPLRPARESTTSPDEQSKRPLNFPTPRLRLEIRDLSSKGSREFLTAVEASSALQKAVEGVLSWLYVPTSSIPGTRSVTVILRAIPGVAYTTGSDLDDDHKEIHFSTDYIAGIPKERKAEEILGVLRHEMVHCWQWNASGTAPGGLIEGIADWIRLRSGFVPPHWTRDGGGDWDAGYQHTGYFLEYIEKTFGAGSVRMINASLKGGRYEEGSFWKKLFGQSVAKLWEDYGKSLQRDDDEEPVMVEINETRVGDSDDAQTKDEKSS
ncbi:MAG: hypothetical protein M1819_004673 [Sarea resinae]|nr:MAG: hypothetical protein M1819_004673 [Sarea resinae]